MLESILIPFSVIFAAEFLDKSQLSVLLLSSKTKKHLSLLAGVLLAFLIVDGLAIFFGSLLTGIIPRFWLQILSGTLFILFGIQSLLSKKETEKKISSPRNAFISGFILIFIAEWGDKTQLASALFATRYDPFPVLIGVMTALTLLSILAVFVGKALLTRFDRHSITKVSGVIFILLGISFFLIQ